MSFAALWTRKASTIADSVGRAAWCKDDAFELTLRENEAGERFLWVLNPSPRATQTANVTVAGVYGSIRDVTLGTGFPVARRSNYGCTTMRVRLAPGDGCVLALGRAARVGGHGHAQADVGILQRAQRREDVLLRGMPA